MRRTTLLVLGAAAVLVSGYMHFYLYFRGGYRGIAPDEVLGLTISRSFVLNAIGALVLAEVLVVAAFVRPRLARLAALGGVAFGVLTLVAYVLSRTTGLLGFEEDSTTTEAVIAGVAELVAVATLLPVALSPAAGEPGSVGPGVPA